MNKLIIFDCDGTLVDSEIVASRNFSRALTAIGYPLTPEENLQRFTGFNDNYVLEILRQEANLDISAQFFTDVHAGILNDLENEIEALMLPTLAAISNVFKTCVASNNVRDRVIHSLKVSQQFEYFAESSIFTAQQVAKSKPAPDLFLFAAEQMGYAPQDCIVIEDSTAGIEAAQAANMKVVGFLGGTHAKYEFYKDKLIPYDVPLANDNEMLTQLINDWAGEEHAALRVTN